VLHLHDPHDASLLGVSPAAVAAAGLPGRLVVAPAGQVAQLALPPPVSAGFGPRAPAVETLPGALTIAGLPPSRVTAGTTVLSLGARFADGLPAALRLHDGEHVLVVGPPRSGRTTALVRIAKAWSDAHPDGVTIAARSRRSVAVRADLLPDGTGELLEAVDARPAGANLLVVVDDAELLDDSGGRLGALAASHTPGVTIVAAGRPDALRQSYGHWTTVVRRSRLGLVMTASNDLDGDLLGAALPRRLPVAARPGLAWIVGDEGPVLAQLAIDDDEPPLAGPIDGALTDPVVEPGDRSRPIVTGAWPGPSPSAARSSARSSASTAGRRWSSD
jgi:S-DNA-T family DNA segregation ATPase FtsK/SpoIIIE